MSSLRVFLVAIALVCTVAVHAQDAPNMEDILVNNLRWLQENKVEHNIAFHQELGLAGVIPEGSTGLHSGDLIFKAPAEALLCGAADDELSQVALQHGMNINPIVSLVHQLLLARVDTTHRFHAIAASLKTVDVPVLWEDAEVALLDNYDYSFAASRREFAAAAIAELETLSVKVPHMVPPHVFTPFNIRWALAQTNACGVNVEDKVCIAPLMSFLRPVAAPANAVMSAINHENGVLTVHTLVDAPAYTTVPLAHKEFSTLELVMNYGLMPAADLEDDYVMVTIGLNANTPFNELRTELLTQLGVDTKNPRLPLYGNKDSVMLMKVLRLNFIRMSELDTVERISAGLPATLRSEREVLRFLIRFCDSALAEYATSLEADELIVASTMAPPRARLAAATRVNRRKLYLAARERLLSSWDAFLDEGWPALAKQSE